MTSRMEGILKRLNDLPEDFFFGSSSPEYECWSFRLSPTHDSTYPGYQLELRIKYNGIPQFSYHKKTDEIIHKKEYWLHVLRDGQHKTVYDSENNVCEDVLTPEELGFLDRFSSQVYKKWRSWEKRKETKKYQDWLPPVSLMANENEPEQGVPNEEQKIPKEQLSLF